MFELTTSRWLFAATLVALPFALTATAQETETPAGEGTGATEGTGAAVPEEPTDAELTALMAALASGEASLESHLDTARGLLWVEYLEAGPADGSTEQHTADRLCGPALAQSQEQLRELLVEMQEREGVTCANDTCTAWGMEYVPTLYVIFARGDDGVPRIVSVQARSEALLGDEWFEAMEPWIQAQMAAFMSAEGCP